MRYSFHNVWSTFAQKAARDLAFTVNGTCPDTGTLGGEYTVWTAGTQQFDRTILAAGEAIEVVSSNAADKPASIGAYTVEIIGLDQDWKFQREIVTMNGTTAVAVPGTWVSVWRASVLTNGNNAVNFGDIDVRRASDATVVEKILIGAGASESARIAVPAGNYGLVFNWNCDGYTNNTALRSITRLLVAGENLEGGRVIGKQQHSPAYNTAPVDQYWVVPEKHHIWVNADPNGAINYTSNFNVVFLSKTELNGNQ